MWLGAFNSADFSTPGGVIVWTQHDSLIVFYSESFLSIYNFLKTTQSYTHVNVTL